MEFLARAHADREAISIPHCRHPDQHDYRDHGLCSSTRPTAPSHPQLAHPIDRFLRRARSSGQKHARWETLTRFHRRHLVEGSRDRHRRGPGTGSTRVLLDARVAVLCHGVVLWVGVAG